MDKVYAEMDAGNYNQGIAALNSIFQLIFELQKKIPGSRQAQIVKYIQYCATYRFAFQLLVGIQQMKSTNQSKREIFLYLILIYLNLKLNQRVHYIAETIQRCIETQNILLADNLLHNLETNLKNNKPDAKDQELISKCKTCLAAAQEKDKANQNLQKVNCPYCKKSLLFKGIKKCSKCNQEFALCNFSLQFIKLDQVIPCNKCGSTFNSAIKKEEEKCPICKLGTLMAKKP